MTQTDCHYYYCECVLMRVCVINYRLILEFQVDDWLPFLVIPDDLCSLPHLLRIWDPDPSQLKTKTHFIPLICLTLMLNTSEHC